MHGRAGREGNEGNVIIQTYNPESFPIECAKEQDYMKFYNQEIKLRKLLKYPPFCDIIKLEVNNYEDDKAHDVINAIYENLLKIHDPRMQICSPMPSPINKINDRYRWRIIIKCILTNNIIKEINLSINNIKNTNNTRISVDINPNNMN